MATAPSKAPLAKATVLSSWKEIAVYLGRGVRTVQRWALELHLPVHKLRRTRRSPVFAFKAEVDYWMLQRARPNEQHSLSSFEKTRQRSSTARAKAMKASGKMSTLLKVHADQVRDLASQLRSFAQPQPCGTHHVAATEPGNVHLECIDTAGFDFLIVDLETAMTLVQIATQSEDLSKKLRNTNQARRAYDTIRKFLGSAALSDAQRMEVDDRLSILKSELERLEGSNASRP